MNLNPQLVEQEISNLLLAYPDLAEDEQLRADMIEGSTSTFEFLSAIVRRIGETSAMLAGLDDYFDELQSRYKRLEQRRNALRELVFRLMQKAELPNAQLPEATLSIRKGTPQLIGDVDPEVLPDRLCRIKREVNRTAIKEWLKSGQIINGFTLSNGEPILSIRST